MGDTNYHQLKTQLLQKQDDLVLQGKWLINDIEKSKLAGNEDVTDSLKSIGSSLGSAAFKGGKWIASMGANGISKAFKLFSHSLSDLIDGSKTKINKFIKRLDKEELKESLSLSSDLITALTSSGDIHHLQDDQKDLETTSEQISKHINEVDAYLEKHLTLVKKIKDVKDNHGALALYEEYKELTYPTLDLSNKTDNGFKSDKLPGGRVVTFNKENIAYQMVIEKVSISNKEINITKDDLKSLLHGSENIIKFNDIIIKNNDKLNNLFTNWYNVITASYHAIENNSSLSDSVKGNLESIMQVNKASIDLYTIFLPRFVNYLDSYINNVFKLTNESFK